MTYMEKYDEEIIFKSISHHIIGGNPNYLEYGFFDTKEEALINFAIQFSKFAQAAKHKLLFVRIPPKLNEERFFEQQKIGYRMIGRFSIIEKITREKKWVGLTDEEINIVGHESLIEFARAIEAKLKEKNG